VRRNPGGDGNREGTGMTASSKKVPLISGGQKAGWYEQMARDGELTPFVVRIGLIIGVHIDRHHTGLAKVSRETIAQEAGGTVRGVEKAIQSLEEHGHIEATKRVVGTSTVNGKTTVVHGGRGGCNTYRLILKTANAGSPFHEEETANPGSPKEPERVNGGSVKGERGFAKGRTGVRTNPYSSPRFFPLAVPDIVPAVMRKGPQERGFAEKTASGEVQLVTPLLVLNRPVAAVEIERPFPEILREAFPTIHEKYSARSRASSPPISDNDIGDRSDAGSVDDFLVDPVISSAAAA
jgi:hypothetical protein